MAIIRLIINTHRDLSESLSDFLIGFQNAAIESALAEDSNQVTLQAFMEKDLRSLDEAGAIAEQVRVFGRELAEIFSCDDRL